MSTPQADIPQAGAGQAQGAAPSPSTELPTVGLPEGFPHALAFWIRTPCGRAKYARLAARPGALARLRLGWFVLIAALRDLGRPIPEHQAVEEENDTRR